MLKPLTKEQKEIMAKMEREWQKVEHSDLNRKAIFQAGYLQGQSDALAMAQRLLKS